jgi:hypothetical protein
MRENGAPEPFSGRRKGERIAGRQQGKGKKEEWEGGGQRGLNEK